MSTIWLYYLSHTVNGGRRGAPPHVWPVPEHQYFYLGTPNGSAQLYKLEMDMTTYNGLPQTLPSLPLQSINIGIPTFNVHGLQSVTKWQSLVCNTNAYSLDFVGFQETKITNILLEKLPEGHVLRCFPLSTLHHGIRFMVSPRLEPHLKRYWSVSDRLEVTEFALRVTRDLQIISMWW